jgi:hypothetical protein
MEDILPDIQSLSFKKKKVQDVFEVLKEAVNEASDIRDQALIKDVAIRSALNIVEDFLRESKRICYGGMAINAHLPPRLKFYDFSKTLPDYDFFTPNPDADIKKLLKMLTGAGFSNVVAKLGIHEGTTKVFVNYNAVADITFLPEWMFRVLQKNAIKDDGILFADINFLRMNMYLELSRPMGEVERWEKVYKRLLLLNSVQNPKLDSKDKKSKVNTVKKSIHQLIIQYLIDQELIFAGAELERVYSHPNTLNASYIYDSTNPVVVLCQTPEVHVSLLKKLIGEKDSSLELKTKIWKPRSEIFPEMYGIMNGDDILVLFVQEHACNAYNTVSVKKQELKILALDTAITLFYTLSYLDDLHGIVPNSVQHFANTLVYISMNTRDKGLPSKFPYFAITCEGHQPSKASLLEAKALRIAALKGKGTRKNTPSASSIVVKKSLYKKTRKVKKGSKGN